MYMCWSTKIPMRLATKRDGGGKAPFSHDAGGNGAAPFWKQPGWDRVYAAETCF